MLTKGAHRFVDAGFAVISLSEYLDKSAFMGVTDHFVLVPPLMGVLQEFLYCFLFELPLQLQLFTNALLV